MGRLTPDQRQDIIGSYLKGVPVAVLADRYAVAASSIYGLLRNRGLGPGRHRLITEQLARHMADDYARGYSLRQVAHRFTISYESVRRALCALGVPMRVRRQAMAQDTRQKIVRQRRAGVPARQVARSQGVSESTVYRIVREQHAGTRQPSRQDCR